MITDRELQLIQAFVVPAKRTRYETFLTSPKRREKFLGQLYHFGDFDPAFVVDLGRTGNSSAALITELRRRGAGDQCYLISVKDDFDGKVTTLEEAIRTVFAFVEGTIVCCVPGRLAYYEGEAPKNRFLLHRLDAA